MGVGTGVIELLIQLKEEAAPARPHLGYRDRSAAVFQQGASSSRVVERLGRLFGVESVPPLPDPKPTTLNQFGGERLSPGHVGCRTLAMARLFIRIDRY